jgi:PPOX class probable F420-dependent enzyme
MIDTTTPAGLRAAQRLATDLIAWLTTVRPDGQPQSSPIWFVWEDGEIVLFSLATTPRLANIRANPRVSFNLNSNADGGDIVTLEGEARIAEAPMPDAVLAAYWAKYDAKITENGWTRESFRADYPVVVRIRLTRARLG